MTKVIICSICNKPIKIERVWNSIYDTFEKGRKLVYKGEGVYHMRCLKATEVQHNHYDCGIKPRGECPACDEYLDKRKLNDRICILGM